MIALQRVVKEEVLHNAGPVTFALPDVSSVENVSKTAGM